MSTNYYATKMEVLATEGSEDGLRKTVTVETRMHIGKSSGRNAFLLHIYPKEGIHTEDDMMAELAKPGWKIEDEYEFEYLSFEIFYKECVKNDSTVVHRDEQYRVGHSLYCDYYDRDFS